MELRNEPNVRQEQRLVRIVVASAIMTVVLAAAFFIAGNFGSSTKTLASGSTPDTYYPSGSISSNGVKTILSNCKSGDTIVINKKLTVNKESKELENKDVIVLIDGSELYWTAKKSVYLGSGSKILLKNGGQVTVKSGYCNSDAAVYFGTTKKVTCDGYNADVSFADVNNAGGVQLSGLTALPVRLIRFEAAKNDRNVNLNWATASEENNSHFEVERSIDGETWNQIGKIQGNGNSQKIIQYVYEDMKVPAIDNIYYRLKQVDFDGKFEYSFVRVVRSYSTGGGGEMHSSVYPNPVNDYLNVKLTEPVNSIIRITDLSGTIKQQVNTSADFETLNTIELPNGIYYVTIISADALINESHRIVVRH